ncbi:DUF368 domain-containing protein [Natranaeroarchaeum aerophilus]|uniref:DUF368 domain-containing protein n=1 Tax=Natranaeroarchaeum aerophilus TaxID=2917711 RepID=A0AAE3FQZ6_9EURY|nr:DUF368 domain-containing protein [Natranaeroarchaeum aerophilus]MCL9813992.1 DUF368 domain-containing protein [Natranaeroarchaeum aerophilus]
MREWLPIYFKGFAMGVADMVPGVSGGTIALITGIYERLVTAITTLDPRLVTYAVRPHDPAARTSFVDGVDRVDLGFLLALGAGIGTAVLAVSRVVGTVAETYPAATAAFFFGLIGASAVVLADQIRLPRRRSIPIMTAGVLIAGGVTLVTAGSVSHALPVVFVAGAIAVSAMVLPGVSGAFFLLVLGQYYFMLDALNGFVDALVGVLSGGSITEVLATGTVVVTFLTGAVVGLLTVAHLVKRALERHRAETLAFLVALMIGGLLLPAQQVTANVSVTVTTESVTTNIVEPLVPILFAVILGAAAVLALDRFTDDLEYAESETPDGTREPTAERG